jgi:hypothetical protein
MAEDSNVLQSIGEYVLNYLAALDALIKEQQYLQGIAQSLIAMQADRAEAAAAAAVIGTKILELESTHETIMGKFKGGVKPPSSDLINKSTKLAQDLATEIRRETIASNILNVVTKFVSNWAALA